MEVSFENRYHVEDITYTPSVTKAITGSPTPMKKDFTFTLEAAADNEPGGAELRNEPGGTSVTVNGEGTKSFLPITFHLPGIYGFTISEEIPDPETGGTKHNGYTYDEKDWTLTVVVEDKDGRLKVQSATYSNGADKDNSTSAVFTNRYKVTQAAYAPAVRKIVEGDERPSEETFRFALSVKEPQGSADSVTGVQLPKDTTVTVTGSDTADFDEITFTEAGEYKFDIAEINEQKPGYTYDGSHWTLTVTVEDKDSILKVTGAVYTKDGVPGGEAVFTNTYDPGEIGFAPQIEKRLDGHVPPTEENFVFELHADEKNPEGAKLAEGGNEVSIKGAGKGAFQPITFDKSGIYRFAITEKRGQTAGYTYDETVWTLEIEVADQSGVLAVKDYTYTSEDARSKDAAEFVNEYRRPETETETKKPYGSGNTSGTSKTAQNAKTGDDTNPAWYLALLGCSGVLLALAGSRRRRRGRK